MEADNKIKQEARVTNASGLVLIIPKEGYGALLFLEWLATFPGGKAPVFSIVNDREEEIFKIRMIAMRQTFLDAKEYINDNL